MKTIYKAVIRHKKENACISKCNAKKMQNKGGVIFPYAYFLFLEEEEESNNSGCFFC